MRTILMDLQIVSLFFMWKWLRMKKATCARVLLAVQTQYEKVEAGFKAEMAISYDLLFFNTTLKRITTTFWAFRTYRGLTLTYIHSYRIKISRFFWSFVFSSNILFKKERNKNQSIYTELVLNLCTTLMFLCVAFYSKRACTSNTRYNNMYELPCFSYVLFILSRRNLYWKGKTNNNIMPIKLTL